MLKHKVSLLILISALTVTAAMPAFASSRYHAAARNYWDDDDWYWDDDDWYWDDDDDWYWDDDDDWYWDDDDDWYGGRGYDTDFDGEADKLRYSERDEWETEQAINSKTGNYDSVVQDAINSGRMTSSNDSYYDSDEYFFFDGGPGYVAKDPVEGSYVKLSNPSASQLGWNTDSVGTYYVRIDLTYPKNTWEYIDGDWYYFNDEGYAQTGWIEYNGSLYYCGGDGKMLSNTTDVNGYTFDESGRLIGLPN